MTMPDDTISDAEISAAQARRFWAIALETGYTRAGVYRLLKDHGYAEAEQISRGEYDEMCAYAEKEDLAFQYDRDPNTRDMFAR